MLKRVDDLANSQAKRRDPSVGNFDIYLFWLYADQIDFLDVSVFKQILAKLLSDLFQLGWRVVRSIQCVDQGVDIPELVIEEGPLNTVRQFTLEIGDFFADLIPLILNGLDRRCVP